LEATLSKIASEQLMKIPGILPTDDDEGSFMGGVIRGGGDSGS